jgi:hypothetical protein
VASLAHGYATLVIFHTSVPGYLDAAGWPAFTTTVRELPGYWISNEIPSAVAFRSFPPSPDPTRLLSVLAQDGRRSPTRARTARTCTGSPDHSFALAPRSCGDLMEMAWRPGENESGFTGND